MKLSDVTTIKTHFEDADFWLIRRGSISKVGKPVREYNPEHIGIKVTRTDILLPNYLYYWFMNLHNNKTWEQLANGTLSLVNIRVSDVRNIRMSPK
jgi:choline kinase